MRHAAPGNIFGIFELIHVLDVPVEVPDQCLLVGIFWLKAQSLLVEMAVTAALAIAITYGSIFVGKSMKRFQIRK